MTALGESDAVGYGQHGNPYLSVLILAGDGQGPEMGRGPEKHDQEQQQRT